MSDIDPAAVMAKHAPAPLYCFDCCDLDGHAVEGPCLPYRLAEALAASEAKVARVEALLNGEVKHIDGPVPEGQKRHVYVLEAAVRRAISHWSETVRSTSCTRARSGRIKGA